MDIDSITRIIVAIVGIGFLILVHESGHFLAAKAFGMRAEKFYIGFPPAIIKRKWGETEYGVGYVPLGGYVKITGMTREEQVPEDVVGRAYFSKPVWQRVVVVSAGALMNVLFAFLLFFIYYWHYVPDFVDTNTISAIQVDSGADRAGLEPGDKILAIDQVESDDPLVLRDQLQSRPDEDATFLIERNGDRFVVRARISRNEDTGDGQLGVYFQKDQVGTLQLPVTEAVTHAARDIPAITRELFVVLKGLFTQEGLEQISTPIGIVAASSETIKLGWGLYIFVLGFISLQLAILNLLPLLPLDGGYVMMNLVEKFKGSPVRKEVYERISAVGLIFFAVLFVIALMNDFQRIIQHGFELSP